MPVSMDWTWPLHLAAMVVFGLMLLQGPLMLGRAFLNRGALIQRMRESTGRSRQLRVTVFSSVPRWLIVACAVMFLYAMINFALSVMKMSDGSPVEKDGKFFLERRGKQVREIDRAEFRRREALEVRAFSGHWMIFSLLPAVYFFCVHGRVRELVAGEEKLAGEIVDEKVTEANPPLAPP
jgi:hypothetical protein